MRIKIGETTKAMLFGGLGGVCATLLSKGMAGWAITFLVLTILLAIVTREE